MTSPATVKSIAIPPGTAIHAAMPGAQFFDAYEVADPHPARTALQTWLDVVARTPRWTQQLMALRNRLVRLVGLKDLGQLHDAHPPASGRAPGDAGSYRRGDAPATLAVSTVVHIHNALGQAYMTVVTPFHRRIVRAMLQRLADHGQR